MRKFSMLICFILSGINVFADDGDASRKKVTTSVGFMIGPTAIHVDRPAGSMYNNYYGPTDAPCFNVAFAFEHYFNAHRKPLYFSVGGRLATTYIETYYQWNYYNGYNYNYNYSDYNHMIIGSLGVSAALNWDIVRGRNAALTAQAAIVPMVEAGQFRGDVQPNAAGELYLGGTFMNKISLGLRGSTRVMYYQYDLDRTVDDARYTLTNISIDVRFRLNEGKSRMVR